MNEDCEKQTQEAGAEPVNEEACAKPARDEETAQGAKKGCSRREAETLREEAKKLQKTLDDEKERYTRMYAEYENFRRRSQKERESAYADATADVLSQIVPMVDNLERAVQSGTGDKVLDGVNMILTQFSETLTKLGVEPYGAAGDTFDPALHHAIMHEEDAEQPENTVTDVFQKGYRKGDRIIRFAMVKVVN